MAAKDRVEADATSTETAAPAPSRRIRKPASDTPAAPDRAPEAAPRPDPAVEAALGIDEDGEDIVAEVVEVHQGAVGRVDASELGVTMGAVGFARADRVDVERGAIGATLAREVHVTQGAVTSVLANEVKLEQAFARTVLAGQVTVEKPSFIGVLIAGHVDGDPKPIVDWRGALVLGVVAGLVMALARRGRSAD